MRVCVRVGGTPPYARQRNPVMRHPVTVLSNARHDWPEAGNLPAHRAALYGNLSDVMGTVRRQYKRHCRRERGGIAPQLGNTEDD